MSVVSSPVLDSDPGCGSPLLLPVVVLVSGVVGSPLVEGGSPDELPSSSVVEGAASVSAATTSSPARQPATSNMQVPNVRTSIEPGSDDTCAWRRQTERRHVAALQPAAS